MNITNQCSNRCSFCVRNVKEGVGGHSLWLEREPTVEEVLTSLGPVNEYSEYVFCGYGEPLIRLQEVLEISYYLKREGAKVRINTNGQANLIHGCRVPPLLEGLVDTISISLNASSREEYNRICHPDDPERAYPSMMDFIKEAREYIEEVILSVVYGSFVDLKKAQDKAKDLGLPLRVR